MAYELAVSPHADDKLTVDSVCIEMFNCEAYGLLVAEEEGFGGFSGRGASLLDSVVDSVLGGLSKLFLSWSKM